jgi:hypothetical protein
VNRAFTERFGYGISTLANADESETDPGPRERGAHGAGADAVQTGHDSDLQRCRDSAYQEYLTPLEEAEEQLSPKYRQLEREISADPRIQDARAAWATCMAAAGYNFASPEEIERYLHNKLLELNSDGSNSPRPDPPAAPGESANIHHHPDGSVHHHTTTSSDRDETSENAPDDSSALARLKAEELTISRFDSRCRDRHVTMVEDQVRREREPPFVDANRALLGRLRGDQPSGGGRATLAVWTVSTLAGGGILLILVRRHRRARR